MTENLSSIDATTRTIDGAYRKQMRKINEALLKKNAVAKKRVLLSCLAAAILIVFLLIVCYRILSTNNQQIRDIDRILNDEIRGLTIVSKQLAMTGKKLTSVNSHQSEAVTRTASAVEEIRCTSDIYSQNMNRSEAMSKDNLLKAQQGMGQMQKLIKSIKELSAHNDHSSSELRGQSQELKNIIQVINEIADKTDVINDIVFQTKLLSFNASVEAARSGEHGKGFAVVAEEVGNLAGMSGKVSKEIFQRISASTSKVSKVIEESTHRVEQLSDKTTSMIHESLDYSGSCNRVLGEMEASFQSLSSVIEEVSRATTEQYKSIKDIQKSISLIQLSAEDSNKSALESAEISNELNYRASKLDEAVTQLAKLAKGA